MYYKRPLNVLWSINFHFNVRYIIFLSSDRQAFYLFIVLNKSDFPKDVRDTKSPGKVKKFAKT